ncbi:hypothetical protein C8R45DRAFT_1090805 [Mycena sanguinolenta]|nr:hypothetical protein C8R45DRAFT_1090805 [Mycena sanguinolenta]
MHTSNPVGWLKPPPTLETMWLKLEPHRCCTIPFYFLLHPAVVRLLPFLHMPLCISFTSFAYLAELLDTALPAFRAFAETVEQVPRSAAQGRLVRALLELSFHIQEALPSRFNEAWLSIAGSCGVNAWLTNFGLMPFPFRFPGVTEFSADHPRMPFPLTPQEHQFFLVYSNQAMLKLTSLICDPSTTQSGSSIVATLDRCRTFFNGLRNVTTSVLPIQLRKQEWFSALPAVPDGDMVVLPRSFVFPTAPHWTEGSDPFPLFDNGRLPDPLWLASAMPTPRSPTPPASSRANSAPPLELSAIDESADDQVQDPPADITLSPMADPIDVATPPVASPPLLGEIENSQQPDAVDYPPFFSLDSLVPPKFRRGSKRAHTSSPTRRRTTSPPLKKPKDLLLEFSGVASAVLIKWPHCQ